MKIICLGDSITFGYGLLHEAKWHGIVENKTGIKMINRGISGDTTDGMVYRLKKQVIGEEADAVIIMGGHNDIFFNRTWETAKDNIKKMVAIATANHCAVILAVPPPMALPVGFKEGGVEVDFEKSAVMLEDYACWLRQYAKAETVPLLDFGASTQFKDPDLFLDGIHPNSKGNRLMAEICIAFLENWQKETRP